MHKLERENKKLKEILARKDEKFNRMVRKKDRDLVKKDREITKNAKELDIERRLWKNRAADWDPGDSTDLHRIEVFDGIISDESSLYSATLKKFQQERRMQQVYVAASAKISTDEYSGTRCETALWPYSWHAGGRYPLQAIRQGPRVQVSRGDGQDTGKKCYPTAVRRFMQDQEPSDFKIR